MADENQENAAFPRSNRAARSFFSHGGRLLVRRFSFEAFSSPSAPRSSGAIVALAAILLLGAALRLLYVDLPLLDAHRWRQVDTAEMARSFYEDSFNVFYPQVNWGGPHGYVESEFPILPALTAIGYKVVGPEEIVGRLVAVAFSVAAIWAMFELGSELGGAATGRAAAFLLAISPAAVYYGRTVMPEAPMLFFAIASVLGFCRYLRTASRQALVMGATAAGLAWLGKLPSIIILAPILGEAWRVRGKRLFEDRAFLVALGAALAVTAAWYVHAFLIYRSTGLTLGVFFPTQTYPLSVAPGPWQPLPKWSSLQTLIDPGFYGDILTRLYTFYLTPTGFGLAAVGWMFWRPNARRVVPDLWFLAMVVFILAVGRGNRDHDYYQIPMLPALALYFAGAAAPAFDGDVLRARVSRRFWPAVVMAVALTPLGIYGFYLSGVIRSHFRPTTLDFRMAEAGRAIESVVTPSELVVTVDYGVNSPMLLYFAHRRGWSFDVPRLSGFLLEQLHRRGARYFATTEWPRIEAEQPMVAAYLNARRRMDPTPGVPGFALFDLSTLK